MQSNEDISSPIALGQRVRFQLGRRIVTGTVTEDRGNIGRHGRRLLRVAVPMDPDEPYTYLVPMDDLHVVQETAEAVVPLDKSSIVEYLKEGGLISILQANSAGGTNQPRVWLCRDTIGNLTHTFVAERGIVGGEQVPFGAIWENKIFSPKVALVSRLLTSFGLSVDEANDVVQSVGTAPL